MGTDRAPRPGDLGRMLVVGAGPVGLVAALLLRRRGIDVDVVDRSLAPVSESRATDLHSATLRHLDAAGVTDDLLAIGRIVRRAVVHVDGRRVGTVALGRPGTPFPHALTVPQCTTEGLLQEHLARHGTEVERGVAVSDVATGSDGAFVDLQGPIGPAERRRYDWVLGCDGAASTVRTALGVDLPGRTTRYGSAIADVEVDLPFPDDELHLLLRAGGGVHVLPMPIEGYVRLLVDHWPGPVDRTPDPEAVVALVGERLGLGPLQPRGVRWTSAFRMHRRVADRFRVGRVLLAGDAAHVCPPVGGQGLNTGVADVAALVPVLAAVLDGTADERALDEVVARRRRAALRTGHLAWTAAAVNALPPGPAATVRAALAPTALRATAPAITRWLTGADTP